MKKTLFYLVLIFGFLQIQAQKPKELAAIDEIMLQIPDSSTNTTTSIANYINQNFNSQSDKSRAVFIWVASNIQYDIANMFAIDFYQKKDQIISKTLRTRKGVCMHYAEVFTEIANKVGLKAYYVTGYTKQNEFVEYISHAWCVALVDTSWCLFDPTWGSGVIFNKKFIRKINNDFYRSKPEKLIKTHMPFDPMWQLLNYPVNSEDFYEGNYNGKNKVYFNFADSIVNHEKLTETEQLIAEANRIELNGVKNTLTFDKLYRIKKELEIIKRQEINKKYNEAVTFSNEAVSLYNAFIDYRNKQFTPKKEDAEITKMIEDVEQSLNKALNKLNEIKNPDMQTSDHMQNLYKSINELMEKTNEQKEFTARYCKTSKPLRKTLFYKKN